MSNNPVTTSLQTLEQGAIDSQTLQDAFGPKSLGIIIINNLPEKYHQLRLKVLKSITVFSKLSPQILESLESSEAFWLVGWSRGKEKLTIQDKAGFTKKVPDTLKGSYYINCSFFINKSLEGPPEEERLKFKDYKAYITLNKWPKIDFTTDILKNFENDCKELCNLIIEISLLVAKACDQYIVKELKDSIHSSNYCESVVKNSYTTKARLLHYYPKNVMDVKQESNNTWCGEHLDHSVLTGLTSALYLDESSISEKTFSELTFEDFASLRELPTSPDPESGLYIKNRHGETIKVEIPKTCLAFQTGSSLQEISNGKFKAVPHYVKGCNVEGIARNTLAVFCQPNLGDMVNDKETFSQYADRILNANH